MATTPRTALLDSATASMQLGTLQGSRNAMDRAAYQRYMKRQQDFQRQQYEDWKRSQQPDTSWGSAFKQGLGRAAMGALPGLLTLNPVMAGVGAGAGFAGGMAAGKGWIPQQAANIGMMGASMAAGKFAGASPAFTSDSSGQDYDNISSADELTGRDWADHGNQNYR